MGANCEARAEPHTGPGGLAMVHFYGVIPMSYQQIEARVNELCENLSLGLDDVFLHLFL